MYKYMQDKNFGSGIVSTLDLLYFVCCVENAIQISIAMACVNSKFLDTLVYILDMATKDLWGFNVLKQGNCVICRIVQCQSNAMDIF